VVLVKVPNIYANILGRCDISNCFFFAPVCS
jgi:hypothetical protein